MLHFLLSAGRKKTLTPCACNSCGVSTPRLFSAHSNPSTFLVLVTAECRQRGALQHVVGRPHTAVTVQDLCNVGAGALANGHVKPGEVGRITNHAGAFGRVYLAEDTQDPGS